MKKIATVLLFFCFMVVTSVPAFASSEEAYLESQKDFIAEQVQALDNLADAPIIQYAEPIGDGYYEVMVQNCKRTITYPNGGRVVEHYSYPFTIYLETDRTYHLGLTMIKCNGTIVCETAVCTVMPGNIGYAYSQIMDENSGFYQNSTFAESMIPGMPEVFLETYKCSRN